MDTFVLSNEFPDPRLLTAADVAERLAVSKRYAYLLMASGTIPSVHIGRSIRVCAADLAAFIASLKRTGD